MSRHDLKELREEISQIDTDILSLVKKRLDVAKKIGKTKKSLGIAIRDFTREKECQAASAQKAGELKISTDFTKNLMHLLMQESLTSQEKDRIGENAKDNHKTAIVLGGAGKMGLWFARFLRSQGYDTTIWDPNLKDIGFDNSYAKNNYLFDEDLIIVATPLSKTSAVLKKLAQIKPKGLVCDISSLKKPVQPGLKALIKAGVKTASIHPMFGPSTQLLADHHIITIDLGSPKNNQEISKLFSSTMAKMHNMSLDEHDHKIAYLLGLSHAVNILFFSVLSKSGEAADFLSKLSSTTFEAQLKIAKQVANENAHLYYEIQALNGFGDKPLAKMASFLEKMRHFIKTKDENQFVELMQNGYDYLQD